MDSVYTAKSIAIPTAFALAGYYTCSSQNALQNILTQPASVSTPVFNQLYHRGVQMVVPGSIITTAAFAYLAYVSREPTKRRMYGASAILAIGVLPWTMGVMMGGIQRLMAISKDSALQLKAGESGEVTRLLKNWSAQNYVRAGFTFTAGFIGLTAALQ